MSRKITIQKVADVSGYSVQTVRRCIIDGDFPFAVAKKSSPDAKKYMYIINPSACAEYFGVSVDSLYNKGE